jgi:hypothetical protein
MSNLRKIELVLRLAVAGEFAGHGLFALQGKSQWAGWISQISGANPLLASKMLVAVGLLDLAVAAIILFKPIRVILLWTIFWGFWTALLRPLVGEPIGDFIERWANWGAPLALYLVTRTPALKGQPVIAPATWLRQYARLHWNARTVEPEGSAGSNSLPETPLLPS